MSAKMTYFVTFLQSLKMPYFNNLLKLLQIWIFTFLAQLLYIRNSNCFIDLSNSTKLWLLECTCIFLAGIQSILIQLCIVREQRHFGKPNLNFNAVRRCPTQEWLMWWRHRAAFFLPDEPVEPSGSLVGLVDLVSWVG